MNVLKKGMAIVLLYIYGVCNAQAGLTEKTLKVGDTAPLLDTVKWIKGNPVNEFKKGHIYVVDFGFIGCVPCMEGWVKMSRLQKEYQNEVTFVIVMTRSSIAQVEKYLDRTGDLISVPVAVDIPVNWNSKQEWMLDNLWVKATSNALDKKLGYPTYYFIDKEGLIAHIGDGKTDFKYQLNLLFGNNEAIAKHEERELKRQELYNEFFHYAGNYPVRKDLNYENIANALQYIEELIKMFPENIVYKRHKFGLLLEIDSPVAYNYGKEVLETYPWEKMSNAWDLAKSWSFLIRKRFFEGEDIDSDLAIAMCLKSAELSNADLLKAMSYRFASEFYFMKGDSKNGEEIMIKAKDLITPESGLSKTFSELLENYKKTNYAELWNKRRKLNN